MKVFSFGGGEGSRDVFPEHVSWSYSVSCFTSLFVGISHLLYHSYLFHKESGAFSSKPFSVSCNAKVLTRRTTGHNVHRGKCITSKLYNVSKVLYGRKVMSGYFDGKLFNLTGPKSLDAIPAGG